MSETTADFIYFLFYGLGITSLSLFSIIGNTLSILVFSRSTMKSSNSTILIGLSIWDLVLLLSYLFSFGLPSLLGNYSELDFKYKVNFSAGVYNHLTSPMRKVAHMGSTYSTLLVSVERYLVVCYPLRCTKWCTRRKALFATIGISTFSMVFNIPRWYYGYAIELSENHIEENGFYMKYYRGWALAIVMYTVLFIVLPILNFKIYEQVRQTNARRQTMTSSQQAEVAISKTLMTIVLVFLLSNAPYALFSLDRIIGTNMVPKYGRMFAHLLVVVNSSLNFVIYLLMGTKFRRELFKLCSKACPWAQSSEFQSSSFTMSQRQQTSVQRSSVRSNVSSTTV